MHTLADLATAVNRTSLYVSDVFKRFEVPRIKEDQYSEAHLAWLRTIIYLRTLNISEERLRDLWHLEKKLLQLLHVDTTGSPTWFLNSCGTKAHARRRLLLTNFDLGFDLPEKSVQLGLNFGAKPPELFAGKEMGEDTLRVLDETLKLHRTITQDAAAERPLLAAANRWAQRFSIDLRHELKAGSEADESEFVPLNGETVIAQAKTRKKSTGGQRHS
jgi:hypothetical protein